ncbi:ATP-dependent Clp protease adapter protein ClpS [Aquisphaera giovannonii]|uniref:ATP-dependent Clp protease adapter protein ClpS n=1 Tax=Aquisphaera giovannonii TaxID=406548 RepID=A0A5B9VYH7_9BACT|nr:ATP-dependent Clp protease adaptor ClpS [Aquisphaera giovannonii]QEH33034.1 ATP-dependent Clp protease adapter protein ClpS [Aquisphaera giovannonii]
MRRFPRGIDEHNTGAEGSAVMEEMSEDMVIRTVPAEQPRVKSSPRRQPPYAVVLHNDDVNGLGFVVNVLRRVFGYRPLKAFRLAITAHVRGRSTVWVGTLEVAELKAEQVLACGPDPAATRASARPLRTSLEPRPAG